MKILFLGLMFLCFSGIAFGQVSDADFERTVVVENLPDVPQYPPGHFYVGSFTDEFEELQRVRTVLSVDTRDVEKNKAMTASIHLPFGIRLFFQDITFSTPIIDVFLIDEPLEEITWGSIPHLNRMVGILHAHEESYIGTIEIPEGISSDVIHLVLKARNEERYNIQEFFISDSSIRFFVETADENDLVIPDVSQADIHNAKKSCRKCPDVNRDGEISMKDVVSVTSWQGENVVDNVHDLTDDGAIDVADVVCVADSVFRDAADVDSCTFSYVAFSDISTTSEHSSVWRIGLGIDTSFVAQFAEDVPVSEVKVTASVDDETMYSSSVPLEDCAITRGGEGDAVYLTRLSCGHVLPTANFEEGDGTVVMTYSVFDEEGRSLHVDHEEPHTFRALQPSHCKEVIPGHNDATDKRANIVFVGYGYTDTADSSGSETIASLATHVVDIEGADEGLFSVEPFRDEENSFNFWYIDESYGIEECQFSDRDIALCGDPDMLAQNCHFSNRYVVRLVNDFFRSSAGSAIHQSAPVRRFEPACDMLEFCDRMDYVGSGCIETTSRALFYGWLPRKDETGIANKLDLNEDGNVDEVDERIADTCGHIRYGCDDQRDCTALPKNVFEDDLQAIFVHEMGHLFGDLDDEYVEHEAFFGKRIREGNCFSLGETTTREECELKTQWSDYVGFGCGEDGLIDCQQGEDARYALEIGCFEGCNKVSQGVFRSAFNTIMRCSTCEPREFGEWNTLLLQEKIDEFDVE